jgi:transmembrane sensor
MMNAKAEEEAIGWVIRTRDPAFADWDAFTAWLEASDSHARLYDALCLADEAVAEQLARSQPASVPLPANDDVPRRRWWIGGATAASLAAVGALLLTQVDRNPFPTQDLRTGPGERRSVQLADGSRIDLNGSTHVVIDGARHARLEQGEALFTIVHDEERPFEVASADHVVRDLGTVFDIVRTPRTFSVTVSEGVIVFNPDEENVRVPAGRSLDEKGGRILVATVSADQVGGWREGRLIYEGAPLARVAEDLSRALGIQVEASPALAARPFSGIIQIEGKGEPALAGAARILGMNVRRSGDRWVLTGP